MTKPGISYEQHLEWGPKLADMQDELIHLTVAISNNLGKSTRATAAARRAYKDLSNLRSLLDTELQRLVPRGDPREQGILCVYYPVRGDDDQVSS
jgi:hypothetical protein